jgi:hypothetical protein
VVCRAIPGAAADQPGVQDWYIPMVNISLAAFYQKYKSFGLGVSSSKVQLWCGLRADGRMHEVYTLRFQQVTLIGSNPRWCRHVRSLKLRFQKGYV